MAPFSVVSAGVVGLLAKSFSVLSCSSSSSLARCTAVLPVYLLPSRGLTTQTGGGPPKRPLNGYMRYVMQQQPTVVRQHPEIRLNEVVSKIAQQWRTLSAEQKRPFEEEFQRARDQFKVDFQRYQDQLSPAEAEQQAAEKKLKMAKRKEIRRKRELSILGKPKRPRSSFNIYMSEHFMEARGLTMPAKLMSLMDDWRNLLSHKKRVYTQLAEDDKIRYKNEMSSWEEHMVEIGREDLLRRQNMPKKKPSKKKMAPTKDEAKPKANAGKKKKMATATATGKTTAGSMKSKWE